MATADLMERLMTAEEFLLLDDGVPSELVRGRVVEIGVPAPLHGFFCALIVRLLGEFVHPRDLGRIMCNDSGVITERDPDSVRGPDISYYSYQRLPKGPLPKGYLSVSPEVAFEVRSPSDSWNKVLAKATELVNAGVLVVSVLDPDEEAFFVFRKDGPPSIVAKDEVLTLPEVLPGFELPVARLFE